MIISEVAIGHKGFECGKSIRVLHFGRALVVSSHQDLMVYSIGRDSGILKENRKNFIIPFEVRDLQIMGDKQEFVVYIGYTNPKISILKVTKVKKTGKETTEFDDFYIQKWMEFPPHFEIQSVEYKGHSIATFPSLNMISTPLILTENGSGNRILDSIQLFKLDIYKRKIIMRRFLYFPSMKINVLFSYEFYGISKNKLIIIGMPLNNHANDIQIYSYYFDLKSLELEQFGNYKNSINKSHSSYKFVRVGEWLAALTNDYDYFRLKYE